MLEEPLKHKKRILCLLVLGCRVANRGMYIVYFGVDSAYVNPSREKTMTNDQHQPFNRGDRCQPLTVLYIRRHWDV